MTTENKVQLETINKIRFIKMIEKAAKNPLLFFVAKTHLNVVFKTTQMFRHELFCGCILC